MAAGIVTAGAAPADAWWHAAFGRDAVLWSPPHLLSVVATLVLLVAVFVGLRSGGSRPLHGSLSRVLLGAGQVVLLEYDTDVPQFAGWLYLPVLVAVNLGTAWVVRSLVGRRYAVTWAVAGCVALRTVVAAVLALAGWPGPDLPLPLLGLLLLDLPGRWAAARWPLAGLGIVAGQLVASATGLSSVGLTDAAIATAVVGPLLLLTARPPARWSPQGCGGRRVAGVPAVPDPTSGPCP